MSYLGYPPNNQSNPTVHPANPFDPRLDAQILLKAMEWSGSEEKWIIEVLTHRVNSQRQEITIQFKTMFGKDLISNLKSELSGKIRDLIVGLMTPTYEFLAKEIHNAIINDVHTDEETIIEIMCTASNAEINNIKMAYHKLFENDLEKDLTRKTSGNFRRFLMSLCQGLRNENTFVDVTSAQADAQKLLQAGELQFDTDDSTLNMILCSRSFCQFQRILLEYHRLTGKEFEDVIKSEFSDSVVNVPREVVKCIRNKSAYFASRLLNCRPDFGPDYKPFIRIIVTRCEIDMVEIKSAYMLMCGRSLEADIAEDTYGDFKRCLLALVSNSK